MNYIIFDLEFNQDLPSLKVGEKTALQNDLSVTNRKGLSQYPFEIIQIGAYKLDSDLTTLTAFNRFIKPTIYSNISPFITELTKITTEQLSKEKPFPEVFNSYIDFIGEPDSILCSWGMVDLNVLYKNAEHHHLDSKLIPRMFINLQPFASTHFGLPQRHLLRLSSAVELLGIPITSDFHNALSDAYYTAEIFKRINNSSIQANLYHPSYVVRRPRQQKKVINFDKLILQFEKIYDRSMTAKEQEMIKLAYKMGRTNQFVELLDQSSDLQTN